MLPFNVVPHILSSFSLGPESLCPNFILSSFCLGPVSVCSNFVQILSNFYPHGNPKFSQTFKVVVYRDTVSVERVFPLIFWSVYCSGDPFQCNKDKYASYIRTVLRYQFSRRYISENFRLCIWIRDPLFLYRARPCFSSISKNILGQNVDLDFREDKTWTMRTKSGKVWGNMGKTSTNCGPTQKLDKIRGTDIEGGHSRVAPHHTGKNSFLTWAAPLTLLQAITSSAQFGMYCSTHRAINKV